VPCLDYSIYHYYNNHRDSPAVSDNRSVFISLLLTPQGSVALKKSNGYYTFKASVSFLAHSICPTPILVNEKLATGLPVTFQASVWRSTIRPIRVTPCAHVHPSYRAFGDLHVVLLFIWQLQAQRLQEHKIFEQGTVSRSQAYRVLPIHSFVRIPHFHSTGTIQFNSTQAVHRHNSSSPVVPPAILQQFSLSFPPFFLVEKNAILNTGAWRAATGHHVRIFIPCLFLPYIPLRLRRGPAHLFLLCPTTKNAAAGCGWRLRPHYSSVNKKVHASPTAHFRFLFRPAL